MLLLVTLSLAPTLTANQAEAASSPKTQAVAAVKREIKNEIAPPSISPGLKIQVSCRRLTTKRFRCSWEATYRGLVSDEVVSVYGKARTTKYRYSTDATLSDVKCFTESGDDTECPSAAS